MAAPLHIGRYVLYDEIASGGMAKVHFGQLVGTAGFAKIVAIKRLHRQLAGEPSFRNVILGEARLAARIRHPNVVPPLDVLAENNELLLVMEYVHGEPLSRLLRIARKHNDRIPVPVASAIIVSALHGLHAAHEAKSETGELLGLVHRDVSPQNILVGADGVVRMIDFGIAKAITSTDETLAGTIKGKVPYLAPEQISGSAPISRKVDIYAASVVMWEMLAGRRLFEGPDDAELLRRIVSARVPPPTGEPALDAIVLAGLSQRPDDRFATAREMALALESAVPPAMATQVAAWVDRLAGAALEERAAIVHRIEAAAAGASQAPPDGFQSGTLVMNAVRAPAPAPSSPTARLPAPGPPLPAPELPTTHQLTPPQPPPMPYVQPVALPPKKGAPLWPLFPGLIIVLLVGAWFAVPIWIEHKAKAWGAERGLTLTFDKIQLSRKSIRFVGVHATSREMPEVQATAVVVVLGLNGTTPETIAIEGADVRAEGTVKDVVYGIGAWYKMHTAVLGDGLASYKQLSIANGQAGWIGFAGPKSELALDGINVDVVYAGTRSFGEDWHAVATKVTAKAGGVELGPWQLQGEREGPLQQGSLRFDSSVENTAAITFMTGTTPPVVSLRIPPTKANELHIPAPDEATPESRFSGSGDLTIASVAEGGMHGKFVLGATSIKSGDDIVDTTLSFTLQDNTPIEAPLVITSKGVPVGQTKLAGDFNGGRLSLFGRTDCGPLVKQSYEAALVIALLPPSDTRLGLDATRCPGK